MGYTQYFEAKRDFTPEEFAQITANRAATVGFCKGLRIYCEQEEIEEEEED